MECFSNNHGKIESLIGGEKIRDKKLMELFSRTEEKNFSFIVYIERKIETIFSTFFIIYIV